MSIHIEKTAACSELTVDKASIDGIRLEDRFGEVICIAKLQAEKLIPILQHFIATGELPE